MQNTTLNGGHTDSTPVFTIYGFFGMNGSKSQVSWRQTTQNICVPHRKQLGDKVMFTKRRESMIATFAADLQINIIDDKISIMIRNLGKRGTSKSK